MFVCSEELMGCVALFFPHDDNDVNDDADHSDDWRGLAGKLLRPATRHCAGNTWGLPAGVYRGKQQRCHRHSSQRLPSLIWSGRRVCSALKKKRVGPLARRWRLAMITDPRKSCGISNTNKRTQNY